MTIVGGRAATVNPRYWMEACPNLDAVICGDGEQAIAEIAQAAVVRSRRTGLPRRRRSIDVQSAAPNVPLDDELMPARTPPAILLLDEQGREHGNQGGPSRRVARLPLPLQVLQLLDQPLGREAVLDAAVDESIVREIEQIDADRFSS